MESTTIFLLTKFKCKKKSLTLNSLISTLDLLALDLLAAIASLEATITFNSVPMHYVILNMENC